MEKPHARGFVLASALETMSSWPSGAGNEQSVSLGKEEEHVEWGWSDTGTPLAPTTK